jgi:hypothetical protein
VSLFKILTYFLTIFINREYTETDSKTEITTSICIIEAKNGYQFKGCGVNKKMAKFDACRIAIKFQNI